MAGGRQRWVPSELLDRREDGACSHGARAPRLLWRGFSSPLLAATCISLSRGSHRRISPLTVVTPMGCHSDRGRARPAARQGRTALRTSLVPPHRRETVGPSGAPPEGSTPPDWSGERGGTRRAATLRPGCTGPTAVGNGWSHLRAGDAASGTGADEIWTPRSW